MLLKNMKEKFPMAAEIYETEYNFVNPLDFFEHYFFSQRRRTENKDYRDMAVDKCISERLDFTLTCNNSFNMIRRFVKIECPECGKLMIGKSGGGSGIMSHMEYKCECGNKADLSYGHDALSFEFAKK